MHGGGRPFLPPAAGTKLSQVQVKYSQEIASAESTDGRQTVPFPETWPIKSNKESCKNKQDSYSSWYTYKHYFVLFQLFLLDPCTGSVLLAKLCFL